ncbi:MAG: hypothetical protein IIC67_01570 [Thaumarchaeota archaeon]|nr:hypothetical protein [Nitrososphaerota archaeon]
MSETYVFDFYNLYIPKGMKYENKELGIKIIPLKLAEEFEKNRTKFSKPYYRGGWNIAKCFIKSKTENDAKKIASWLEFLYSFAQSRSVFFLSWYKYKNGRKYSSSQAKFVEHRENRFSELVYAVYVSKARYTRDISLFIDTALKKLNDSKDEELNKILTTIHAFLVSNSQMAQELKFLICWMALEKLANIYYNAYKSKNRLFSKDELKKLKFDLESALKKSLGSDERLELVRKSITRNFLYEHNTFEKIMLYSDHLDLGFDKKKLRKVLSNLIEVRGSLVHDLHSTSLTKTPQLLFYLQLIMENVMFRVLGIDKNMQKTLLLNQYNRGNEL